jgi:hypothetical protein
MKTLLSTLTVVALLLSTFPQSAWTHPRMNTFQGDHKPTAFYEHAADQKDRHTRDETRRQRFFIRQPWFWDVASSCYEFGPDCVLVVLSPEQEAYAQEHVDAYLAAVRQGLRRAPSHRYVVIEALPMTSGGRCVIVFDARTGKFVSHGGYIVGGLPPAGSVIRLAAVRAELVV